nr:hypothetical protein BaRGS_003610 [Batillaria attramentaria]
MKRIVASCLGWVGVQLIQPIVTKFAMSLEGHLGENIGKRNKIKSIKFGVGVQTSQPIATKFAMSLDK